MKIIPKKQKGGSFTSFFATYKPVQGPGSLFGETSQKTTSSSNEDKGKLTEKDLFTMLKDVDGLPNEMQSIFSEIQMMYDSGLPSSSIASLYAQTLNDIKQARFNKEQYDNVFELVKSNQGINDYAVTSDGKVIAYNKEGQLVPIDVQECMQNPDKYRPITNSNILHLRAHNPNFASRQGDFLLEIASNGIGINQVEKMLRDRLRSLGTSEQHYEGLSAKQGEQVAYGIDVLNQAIEHNESTGNNLTLDGLYETKVITKEQKKQAEAALKYIYQTLPENAKAILQLHSGNSANPELGAITIIDNLITQGMNSSYTVSHDYKYGYDVTGSKLDDGGEGDDKYKRNTAEQWLLGYGQKESYTINPGTNLAVEITSTGLPIVTKSGEPLAVGSSLKDVTSSQFGGLLNWGQASMGGQKLNPSRYDQIILSDNMIRNVDFPINPDGTPNLNPTTIENVQKYRKLAKDAGIDLDNPASVKQNASTLNRILQTCELPIAYDSEGNYISGRWKKFAVLQGVTTSDALDQKANLGLFREIKDRSSIDNYRRIMEKNIDAKLDYDYDDAGEWFGMSDYTHMLEGTIWIPVYENVFNAAAGSGKEMTPQRGIKTYTQQYETDNYKKRQELLSHYNNLQF